MIIVSDLHLICRTYFGSSHRCRFVKNQLDKKNIGSGENGEENIGRYRVDVGAKEMYKKKLLRSRLRWEMKNWQREQMPPEGEGKKEARKTENAMGGRKESRNKI